MWALETWGVEGKKSNKGLFQDTHDSQVPHSPPPGPVPSLWVPISLGLSGLWGHMGQKL